MLKNSRINRAKKTVEIMIKFYCSHHHSKDELCEECRELLNYAMMRLSHCKFGENKPACEKCKIHCYKPDMRERIKKVMRYSGPRMLFIHPVLAIEHVIDGFKK